jgi:hypothetical protein
VVLGDTMRRRRLVRKPFQRERTSPHLPSQWTEDEALPKQIIASRQGLAPTTMPSHLSGFSRCPSTRTHPLLVSVQHLGSSRTHQRYPLVVICTLHDRTSLTWLSCAGQKNTLPNPYRPRTAFQECETKIQKAIEPVRHCTGPTAVLHCRSTCRADHLP